MAFLDRSLQVKLEPLIIWESSIAPERCDVIAPRRANRIAPKRADGMRRETQPNE